MIIEALSFQPSALQGIDLGRHNEVALGQAIDLVSPQGDFGFAPGQ
jgi:hypothetical protein